MKQSFITRIQQLEIFPHRISRRALRPMYAALGSTGSLVFSGDMPGVFVSAVTADGRAVYVSLTRPQAAHLARKLADYGNTYGTEDNE